MQNSITGGMGQIIKHSKGSNN